MQDRYSRQIIVPGIGEEGQARLAASSVVIIGCGALGTVSASSLVRAGVGRVRIIKNELPKAVAAERRLRKINSTIEIEGIVADANHTNIEGFVEGADLILDGLDNFEARFLINDVSLKHGIPWVYGAAIGASGMTASFIPGKTPCFRCLSASAPVAGMVGTCDTVGVLGPAPFIVGSLQAAAALRMLVGAPLGAPLGAPPGAAEADPALTLIDVWKGTFNRLRMGHREDCPACAGQYDFLDGKLGLETTSLCGQNVVQVLNTGGAVISLPEMAARLEPVADNVTHNEHMLRFGVGEDREMIVFPDGRALVRNTTDESLARALYARYVGT